MKINKSKIKILDKRKGSVILTLRISINNNHTSEKIVNNLKKVLYESLQQEIDYPLLAVYHGQQRVYL